MTTTRIAGFIDHTNLKATATTKDIGDLCAEAICWQFKAVCINQNFVSFATKELEDTGVLVATVIGFPLGATTTAVKAYEAATAAAAGAAEVDMVINIGALKAGDYRYVLTDIHNVVKAADGATVKVIIETCYLGDDEKILACQLAVEAGAHFVKTSTGFGSGGATIEDVALMKKTLGGHAEVKASGGIRDLDTLRAMVAAGATRIGTSSGVQIIQNLIRN